MRGHSYANAQQAQEGQMWTAMWSLPFGSFVTLGKLINLSEPLFLQLQKGGGKNTYLTGLV